MKSKDYFNEVAPRWDQLRESFFSSSVREKALDVANVQPGRIAADIGCGTGFITEGLVERGLKVIAVDGSPAMLNAMRQKFSGQDSIDFRMGEAGSLPIPDETVDYSFANMYLHHLEDPLQAILEMARILKPGGVLVITDLDQHKNEFLKQEHNDRWMGFVRDDIRRWLHEAGLRDVSVECVGENCCATSSSGKECAEISIFVASGVRRSISHR